MASIGWIVGKGDHYSTSKLLSMFGTTDHWIIFLSISCFFSYLLLLFLEILRVIINENLLEKVSTILVLLKSSVVNPNCHVGEQLDPTHEEVDVVGQNKHEKDQECLGRLLYLILNKKETSHECEDL